MGLGSLGRGRVQPIHGAVSQESAETRADFIRKTYVHLAGAMLAFVVLEYLFVTSEAGYNFYRWAWGGEYYNWLMVIGGFMVVGWIADKWAHSNVSQSTQYIGLGIYVVAEVVIMCPLLWICANLADNPNLIPMAGIMTLLMFGGLTATVFITKKDFSFMRGALMLASFGALGVIVGGMMFGFDLGLFFSVAMIALASGYVLYYTSNVIHHYRPGQHVAASLSLFAAVALMFYYMLILLLELTSD